MQQTGTLATVWEPLVGHFPVLAAFLSSARINSCKCNSDSPFTSPRHQLNLNSRFKGICVLRNPQLLHLALLLTWFVIACLIATFDQKLDYRAAGTIFTLLLLGLLTIPFKAALGSGRSAFQKAITSAVSLVLCCTLLSAPSEAATACGTGLSATLKAESGATTAAAGKAAFNYNRVEKSEQKKSQSAAISTNATISHPSDDRTQESDPTAFSFCEENSEDEEPFSKGDKHNQLSVVHKSIPSHSAVCSSVSPLTPPRASIDAVWIKSHGHQLQLYNTSDQSDSYKAAANASPTIVRPSSLKNGGLFHVLSRSHRGFLLTQPAKGGNTPNSLLGKTAKCISYSFQVALFKDNSWSQIPAHQPIHANGACRYWLVNQAFLL